MIRRAIPPQGFGAQPDNITLETDPVTGRLRIKDLGVSTAKLADGAVNTLKLADLSVTNPKLANLAVDSSKLADGAVTRSKLADLSVSEFKLAVHVRHALKHLRLAFTYGSYVEVHGGTTTTTGTMPADTNIRLQPFIFPNTVTIDRIRVNVTTAGGTGNRARFAIYTANYNPTDLMTQYYLLPASKIASTELDYSTTATGIKELVLTTPIQIDAGTVYWVAHQQNNTGAAPTMSAITLGQMPYIGSSNTTFANDYTSLIRSSAAYGTLPNTFSYTDWDSMTLSTLNIIAVQVRLASIIDHN